MNDEGLTLTRRVELTEKVKLAFDESGISIPYPQTDVHLHSVKKD